MKNLIQEIRSCTLCTPHLKDGVNPVFAVSPESRIAIIGQAPGSVVHKTGIPWDDKSGIRLREWMQVSTEEFYDTSLFAIVPMGFCYPGKGKTGDLAPRKECAPLWHAPLFGMMPNIEMVLLIGNYAQKYYLATAKNKTLTERVESYKQFLPKYFPLPHPSPRNNIWLKKNQWFENEVLTDLQYAVHKLMQ